MSLHPRLSLNQAGFLKETTADFIHFARGIGAQHLCIANPHAMGPQVLDEVLAALEPGGVRVSALMQPFARYPDIARDSGGAAEAMDRAIDAADRLGARDIYLISGGRGALSWEAAAQRMTDLIAPCVARAASLGIALSVETSNLLNADIHIAHTLDDTIKLAELAGIGVTLDFGAIWVESDLKAKFARAAPLTRLVQVCDHVPGDRCTPFKAVPGDGAIPNEALIADLLALGYKGLFDLELVGQRIEAEGHRAAFARGAQVLSAMLERLGA
jgi:sugar phosphate isomerase/epimerase